MVLFVLYVVLTFESVDEILWCYYSHVTSSTVFSHGDICFVRSCNFESVDEIPWCDHSNESSLAERLHSTIYFVGFYKAKF